MEKLIVEDFLLIKSAEIDVKKFNILIGPQANGKSILAKLLYFFKNIPTSQFKLGIERGFTKHDICKNLKDQFQSFFPTYTWDGSTFKISYIVNNAEFTIIGEQKKNKKTSLKISFSDDFFRFYVKLKGLYKRKLTEESERKKEKRIIPHTRLTRKIFYEYIEPRIEQSMYKDIFETCIFIPASRSFFANLQKNIFTFIASNIDIDPFLKQFGEIYESSKFWYRDDLILSKDKTMLQNIYSIMEKIINGEYLYIKDQDWIKMKNKKINLANASSGQQEALPMLLVLSMLPMLGDFNKGSFAFIEEPEAHLFPFSQKQVIDLLSVLYAKKGTSFFITTHSPYIISAINILIQANEALAANDNYHDIKGLLQDGFPVKFSDVAAYTIMEGKSIDIVDYEYKIIGTSVIDNVSDYFDEALDRIMQGA